MDPKKLGHEDKGSTSDQHCGPWESYLQMAWVTHPDGRLHPPGQCWD